MSMKQEFFSWLRSIGGGFVVAVLCAGLVLAAIISAPIALALGLFGFLDTQKDTGKKEKV